MQNTILGLWDMNGEWCDERDSIAQAATSYFESTYITSHPSHMDEVIAAVLIKVTEDMNARLTQHFSKEEVVTALKQIHPTKTLGPDGMSVIFYQKYWSIVGNGVTNLVLNVLNGRMPIAELNKTNIALILKTGNPKRMTEFRQISLCNMVYKIISKTFANRLKPLLFQIITENQSAFTPDRLIIDNVLMAFELMHYLNHKAFDKDGYMVAKLDMSKAFDKVEWGFIQKMMEKLSFNTRWVNLIMQCITSVTYSVLIHRVPHGNITPTRGLR